MVVSGIGTVRVVGKGRGITDNSCISIGVGRPGGILSRS